MTSDPGEDRGRLVVIDMQRIFATGPWCAPRFGEVVPVVRRLADAFGDQVTYTRFVAPERPEGAWRAYYEQWPFALQPPDAPDYELVDDYADASHTVVATTFGKWDALRSALAPEPGDRLVVCGVSTDCCVISTVLAAADAGMRVQVIADACAGIDDASHQKALDVMALYGPLVEITTSTDVLG